MVLYARQWLDHESAQDIVQEACVALFSQQSEPTNPVAWMYRVIRNAAIDQARADQSRRRREQSAAQHQRDWFEQNLDETLDARLAQATLQRLPVELREVVTLRIWGQLGFVEIAEVMEIGLGTAHERYYRALGELRNLLEKPCQK